MKVVYGDIDKLVSAAINADRLCSPEATQENFLNIIGNVTDDVVQSERAARPAITLERQGSREKTTTTGAISTARSPSIAPTNTLIQNNVEICSSVTSTRWTVAAESPKSLNISKTPVRAVTMATNPKS